MGITTRLIFGSVVSAFFTFWLFVGIKALIITEFKPQKKIAQDIFEINPELEEIEIKDWRTKIPKLDRVETPPAPPSIEIIEATKPKTKLVAIDGEIPIMKIPEFKPVDIKITPADRNPEPILRIKPILPRAANSSGHCNMLFDISAEGKPYNIVATSCSRKLFERNSIRSVSGWKYRPQIVNGRPTPYQGVKTRVVYNVMDEKGNRIPE